MDDRRIYDAYIASRQSAALVAASHLGLFDALAPAPLELPALAAQLGLGLRPVDLLTRALVAMGLLLRTERGLALAEDAARYLVRERPEWLGGLLELEVDDFLSPALLLEALRRGGPAVYGGGDPWAAHERDPARARAFAAAMQSISALPARALAAAVDLSGAKRLLDAGGGTGTFALELARAWPTLFCVVLELEAVVPLARAAIQAAGLGARVEARAGDLFAAWPDGFDAVLLSQVLHDWPPAKALAILRRARAALAPGGRVIVHEKLVADDGSGPLANALVHLDMLVWTEGQQYTRAELAGLLAEAGFAQPSARAGHGYWTILEAVRV
jgi:acetylserotonin N-methyltransferase